jgi:hypothetical protein
MANSPSLMIVFAGLLIACARQPPHAPEPAPQTRIHLDGYPPLIRPIGDRFAVQFNDEPPIVQVSDGRGGPPISYHGQPVMADRVKSIRILTADEARDRFKDQTLVGAVLFELK